MYSEKQLEAAFNAGCAYTVGSHKDLKQIHPNFQEWKAKLKRMRTINELLIILRDNARVKKSWFGLKHNINSGLCSEIDNLLWNFYFDNTTPHVNSMEALVLRDYLCKNRPNGAAQYSFYWPVGLWEPRLKWLNEQIELTKEV